MERDRVRTLGLLQGEAFHYDWRMHRFFLPPEATRGAELRLEGREAHHALHVLRVRAGEEVSVLNGAGDEFTCRVGEASRHSVTLMVQATRSMPREKFQITLLQAIPKGKAWESILEKATELGTHRIIPLLTERTVVHIDRDDTEKIEKWRWVAIDSIKQCGNPWLPQIDAPRKLSEVRESLPQFDLSIVASLQPQTQHPRALFDEYVRDHGKRPRTVAVWVGPEGDFTPGEIQGIIAGGARPITLGPLVLRADTAATCCLGIANYELRFGE